MGTGCQRNVDAVVDEEQRLRPDDLPQSDRQSVQLGGRQVLLAKLDDIDPALDRRLDDLVEATVAAGLSGQSPA